MATITDTGAVRRGRWQCWQCWLLCPLMALSSVLGPAQAADTGGAAAKTSYRIVQLSHRPATSVAGINDKGQVAFTEFTNVSRAKFYDGRTVRDLGTFGGPSALAFALNDRGQVAGSATLDPSGIINHAFRWSAATGLREITRDPQAASSAQTINNKGELAGFATFGPPDRPVSHAFFWSPATGVLDIGTLDDSSIALALNDAGTAVGYSVTATDQPFALRAFRWSRAGGLRDLGIPRGEFTSAQDINEAGHIVGGSPAYLWTPKRGPIYFGTGTGDRSRATKVNEHDLVVGFVARGTSYTHGFIWSRDSGLLEIGRDRPDIDTSANDVNNLGQVVGGIGDRAYVWTRKEGFVDLNTRIPGAPRGLRLIAGAAVSDNGSIVAFANTGLVLLIPQCRCTTEPPVLGPVKLSGAPRTNVTLSLAADFTDADLRDTHKATWSWGDGATDAGIVNGKNGAGNVSGQHVYRSPGIYTASLTLTDSSGKSATVQRKVVVCGTGDCVAGDGAFLSPAPAAIARSGTGIASFALLDVANGKADIKFSAPGIGFHSQQIDTRSIQAGQLRYGGKGSVNGVAGYHFMLSATSGAGKERVRMRIWHYPPGSASAIVDYDNQSARPAMGDGAEGAPLGEGALRVQSD